MGLYFLCSINKGAVSAQLICVIVFAYAKSRFSLKLSQCDCICLCENLSLEFLIKLDAASECSQRLEISSFTYKSRGLMVPVQQKTNGLIRLCKHAALSTCLFLAYTNQVF